MRRVRPRLRQWVWLAVLAWLGQMALPGLSQARGATTGVPGWGDVCSVLDAWSTGPGVAKPASDGSDALWHGLSHCPLCAPGANPWMLPTPVASSWPRRDADEAVASAGPQAPAIAAPLCLKALPRAPPTLA